MRIRTKKPQVPQVNKEPETNPIYLSIGTKQTHIVINV